MAGLVPAIHVFSAAGALKSWMPGSSPGMTGREGTPRCGASCVHPPRASYIDQTCQTAHASSTNMTSRSRGIICPRFALELPALQSEGAGKTGCRLHPRSRVPMHTTRCGTRAYRYSGSIPAFPAQWLYGLLRALPGERLFCLRRRAENFHANLTPAPRRPNHTTSPYAQGAYVSRAPRVHRIPPHVRDDRERPSMGETGGVMRLICAACEAEYF